MPTSTDLMGLGMPAELAANLGNQPNVVTCAGTTQAAATTIKTHNSELSAAASQTGAVFQATAKIGTPFFLFTSSSTPAVIYVPSGHNLNGIANGTFTLAQNKAAVAFQYKSGNWFTILTA